MLCPYASIFSAVMLSYVAKRYHRQLYATPAIGQSRILTRPWGYLKNNHLTCFLGGLSGSLRLLVSVLEGQKKVRSPCSFVQ